MVVHDTAGFMIALHNQLFNLKYTPLSHGAPGFSSRKSVGLHHFFCALSILEYGIVKLLALIGHRYTLDLFFFFFTWFYYVLNVIYHENESAVTICYYYFFFGSK